MPTHSFLTLIKRNIPHTVTHWYHTIHLLWVRLRGNFNSSHVRPFSYSHLNYFLLFQVKWFIHLCKFSDLWKKKRTFMGQVSYDFNENLKQKMKMFVCSDRRVLSSPYENFRVGIRSKQELHRFAIKRSLIGLRNCPCPLGFGSSTLSLNTLYHPVRGVKNGCETR